MKQIPISIKYHQNGESKEIRAMLTNVPNDFSLYLTEKIALQEAQELIKKMKDTLFISIWIGKA